MAVPRQGHPDQHQHGPMSQASAKGDWRQGMSWGEIGFVCFLVVAVVCVFLSGRFAYREAALFQQAKDNGQTFLKWALQLSTADEYKSSLMPKGCLPLQSVSANEPGASALTWGRCREQLFGHQGRLAGMANPFGVQASVLSASCERGHFAGRGAMVIEKGTSSPPGFPPSVSYAPIDDEEPMVHGLQLRILVCDPSGYGVRVGEVRL